MNLTSCEHCGVVLDKDQLEFPSFDDVDYPDGKDDSMYPDDRFICVGRCNWAPYVRCPVCDNPVPGDPEHDD